MAVGQLRGSAWLLRWLRRLTSLTQPRQELGNPTRDHVKDRREYKTECGHSNHAGKHGGTQRLTQLRAGANCPDQWSDAEDKGKRRHQDRTQSQPGGINRGLPAAMAAILELPREFDDEDGVLGGKADQHDKADLSQNIV